MNRIRKNILIWLFLVTGFFVACTQRAINPSATEINSEVIQTAAAQTLAALGTQPSIEQGKRIYLYMPLAFGNEQEDENQSGEPYPMDDKAREVTPTPTNSLTPTATVTKTPTPVTPTPAPCLAAKFIQHINVPPGSQFIGGSKFTKIWRVENVGSCPWYSNYTLVLVAGDGMGGGSDVLINASVAPGQTVDILIDLTAPKNNGRYKSAWMLYNLTGQVFGVGNDATGYLWVDIKVVNSATATPKSSKATSPPKPSATTAPSSTIMPTITRTPTPTPSSTVTPTPTLTDTPT